MLQIKAAFRYAILLAASSAPVLCQQPMAQQQVVHFSGIVPSLSVTAETAPEVPIGLPKRSEAGVGALMPVRLLPSFCVYFFD
jgi:hypothetical protein